ncbi:hypothetical protein [Thomasclavelia sp.]|uniref:hypothetical protein n=1 Tax=Thomasclavelia sp. TaxID=3025757 RepID=UPI0025E88963|nr:hypothetical protein [Thomasclavelia sp.]
MNYVQPTRSAFIIPHGAKLKRKNESEALRRQMDSLRKCLNKEKSSDSKRVYEVELADE